MGRITISPTSEYQVNKQEVESEELNLPEVSDISTVSTFTPKDYLKEYVVIDTNILPNLEERLSKLERTPNILPVETYTVIENKPDNSYVDIKIQELEDKIESIFPYVVPSPNYDDTQLKEYIMDLRQMYASIQKKLNVPKEKKKDYIKPLVVLNIVLLLINIFKVLGG
jgi:hypothetical protein